MNEEAKQLAQCNRFKELVKSETFQELLKVLALKIKSLDTVRDIKDDNLKNIAIEQSARKLAIETIEVWLSELLGICDFDKYIGNEIESRDDIIKRLEDKKDNY